MSSAIIAEDFIGSKKNEYIGFVNHLGSGICFSDDKWVCDRLRRAPSEKASVFTLYFVRIPEQHREMVKYFSAISLIRGKSIATVKTYVCDLIRFFDFWAARKRTDALYLCDEFTAAEFYRYLEERGLSEATNIGVWSSVSTFFKTMNGWNDLIKTYSRYPPIAASEDSTISIFRKTLRYNWMPYLKEMKSPFICDAPTGSSD